MRVLISGGGSGGHVSPAVAIANHLRAKNQDIQIAFAGTKRGLENEVIPREGYKLYHLKVRPFNRRKKISAANFNAAVKAFTSQLAAKKIIKDFKPDVVVGTGGYVSWPVLSAAAKQKIPTVIHEQNALPGLTTKMLAKTADRVMISFDESRKYFKNGADEKFVYTGNPVKHEFFSIDQKEAKEELASGKFMILSVGGSMGAEKINEVIIDFMDKYSKNKDITHHHVTGARGYGEYSRLFENKSLNSCRNLFLHEYIYDICKYYAAADIVICRAGALTLTELAVLKKAAILIPSPYVAENHQYENAKALEKQKAAMIIEEKNLTAEALIERTEELARDGAKLSDMAENIGKFAFEGTLGKIYDIIMETKEKNGKK
ncbi:MAG: undecaprenyldiphospho-muramoylpentapeptide beta-N-acetylglucosaminyltransferase [Oscillospiraceae bacterium]|nr:undecaprenyldiphospho-muramoylpentapeptide beta-N-acetylglucosaminyltransferase [Oscillospiraceae bacterium]